MPTSLFEFAAGIATLAGDPDTTPVEAFAALAIGLSAFCYSQDESTDADTVLSAIAMLLSTASNHPDEAFIDFRPEAQPGELEAALADFIVGALDVLPDDFAVALREAL